MVHRPNAEWHDPMEGIDYRITAGQGGKRRFRADQRPGPEYRPGKRPTKKAPGSATFLTAPVAPELDGPVSALEPPEPPPRPPAHWAHLYSIPELAHIRRAGATYTRLAELAGGVDINTVREWLLQADFDPWGWRPGMAQKCFGCEQVYSPWALRQRGRGTGSRWPTTYCSKTCQDEQYNARPPS